jgi:hypothetical protein
MELSRRILLKGLVAVGLVPAVALATPTPEYPFGPDYIVVHLKYLMQAYENDNYLDNRAMWLRHKLLTLRKNNPDKKLVLIVEHDPWQSTMPVTAAYTPDIIVRVHKDGRREVYKDRSTTLPRFI